MHAIKHQTKWVVIVYLPSKKYLPSLLNAGRNNKWRTCILIEHLSVFAPSNYSGKEAGRFIYAGTPLGVFRHTRVTLTWYSWASDVCVTSIISTALAVCHQSHSNSVETGVSVKIEFSTCPRRQPNVPIIYEALCLGLRIKVALI